MSADLIQRARDMGASLTCHPVANGTIDCTEAAGELLTECADALDVLKALDARLRNCMAFGLSAAEAYDSFYQAETDRALHGGER